MNRVESLTDRQTGLSNVESKIITIIRTIAMFFIILCHYLTLFNGLDALSQLFNVGVPIFFIISGFLYGQKTIDNVWKWYRKQLIKIIIPLYMYYLISGLILFALGKIGEIHFFDTIKVLLNLQGLCGGKIGNIQTDHLWFITFILICYLVTPLLQMLKFRINLFKAFLFVILASCGWMVIILNIRNFYFISWIPGVLSYVFAYFFAAYWKRNKQLPVWLVSIVLAIISVVSRLLVKHIADNGSVLISKLYDCVIVPFSQCFLAFGIFFTIYFICLRLNKLSSSLEKVFRFSDSYSYYVYIVHYMFLEGAVALVLYVNNIFLVSLLFIAFTVLYSIILKWISAYEIRFINKRLK